MRIGTRVSFAFVAFFVPLVAPRAANARPPDQQGAESSATSPKDGPTMSEREKAGLRGPVEECIEESTTPPGPSSRAWRMVTTTKYDPDGRIYQRGYVNHDGSKGVESLTYDTEGHLLRTVWDAQDGTRDTIYTYDSRGRLIGITGEPYRSTIFEYDDQGHKTRIVKSELKAPSSSTGNQGSGIQIESDDLVAFPPPGGRVKTLFNERDQPIESQVYAVSGDLTSRLTRTYDAKGRVADSSYVIEDFEILLSPKDRERLATDPVASEEIKTQFVELLGDQRSLFRISYIYDDEDRVVEKHDRVGSRETITKITYNDHGDEMEEIRTTSDPPHSTEENVVIFRYQYDSVGNWTEKIASSPPTAKEPSRIWSIDHRTITYY